MIMRTFGKRSSSTFSCGMPRSWVTRCPYGAKQNLHTTPVSEIVLSLPPRPQKSKNSGQ